MAEKMTNREEAPALPWDPVQSPSKFVSEFLAAYLKNGLGSMTKRETEILVLHLLETYSPIGKKQNHEISIDLRVPENRIRNLRYEARLRHVADVDAYARRHFEQLLGRAQLLPKDDEVCFVVEDTYLKHALLGRLKEKGFFASWRQNAEVVRVPTDAFVELVTSLLTDEEREQLEQKVREATGKSVGVKEGLRKALALVREGAEDSAVDLVKAGLKPSNILKWAPLIAAAF